MTRNKKSSDKSDHLCELQSSHPNKCGPVQMIGFRWLEQWNSCLSRVQYNSCHTMMTSLLVPPPSVRGKNNVDYDAFKIKLKNVPSLILPHSSLYKFKGKLKNFLLKFPKFKSVQTHDPEKTCIIYLDPRTIKDIPDSLKEDIQWNQSFKEMELQLTYENWTCDEVLRAILPKDVGVPTSYSLIGHIAHMNLRDEQLPYKHVIGQVFLDKLHTAKTIVNKVNTIENKYRNFAMEILVGEENTHVTVKENNNTYSFDFAKVYWNPRLSTEHAALVNSLTAGDVLYDVFAGVGPFAIPAARKGVRVLANDLNPESYKWLLHNAQTNKVTKLLSAFNKDGREFLKDEVRKDILDRREKNVPGTENIAMNLPAMAVEFLDVFYDWLNSEDVEKVLTKPPRIHVYCFIKANKNEDFKALAKNLVEEKLKTEIPSGALLKIHHVRNVAPCKEMMRVSFLLTKEILKCEEPAKKRSKLENDNADHNFLGNNGEEQVQSEERV